MSDPQEVHVLDLPLEVDVEVMLERDEFNFVLSPVDAAGVALFRKVLDGHDDMMTWRHAGAHVDRVGGRTNGASYYIAATRPITIRHDPTWSEPGWLSTMRIKLCYTEGSEQRIIDELRSANRFGSCVTVDQSSVPERVVLVPSTRCKHCNAMLHTRELDYSTCDACAEKCDHGMSEAAVLRGILPVQPMYCGKCGRRNPKWGAGVKSVLDASSSN